MAWTLSLFKAILSRIFQLILICEFEILKKKSYEILSPVAQTSPEVILRKKNID